MLDLLHTTCYCSIVHSVVHKIIHFFKKNITPMVTEDPGWIRCLHLSVVEIVSYHKHMFCYFTMLICDLCAFVE